MLTLEHVNDILDRVMTSTQNKFIPVIYILSWIFIGNYSLLNLFLAVLLDGFTSDDVDKDL